MNHADSYTSSEFEQFINDISGYDISQVIDTKPGIIHGCGINADDNRTIEFLKTYKISVLWAPVSNLLLYKDTLQISKLLSNGINVVLGSDWSPSGSKHVWEEAKFARFFAQEEDPSITDLDIYQMVTLNAANCIGPVKVGAIREGYMGDFFILRRDDINQEPLEAFFSCNDTNVRGVIVNGRIVYGDEDFMSPYGFDYQHFPIDEGEAAANKVVSIPSELKFRMIRDVCRIEALLKEVPPYWDRSRFLSTDDTYYLDRIQDLKRFIITTFSLK
jgi:5-methylthioadenosine/S-adenosylhomocysteine deaminase